MGEPPTKFVPDILHAGKKQINLKPIKIMKLLNDELPGSTRGGAMTEIAPSILKRIKKIFRRNCRQYKKLEINNQRGGIVCLIVNESIKEDISQLILECKGNINNARL